MAKSCIVFAKKTDEEIFVIVPMEDMGGQVEFVVTYTNFFLEIKAKSRKNHDSIAIS